MGPGSFTPGRVPIVGPTIPGSYLVWEVDQSLPIVAGLTMSDTVDIGTNQTLPMASGVTFACDVVEAGTETLPMTAGISFSCEVSPGGVASRRPQRNTRRPHGNHR